MHWDFHLEETDKPSYYLTTFIIAYTRRFQDAPGGILRKYKCMDDKIHYDCHAQ